MFFITKLMYLMRVRKFGEFKLYSKLSFLYNNQNKLCRRLIGMVMRKFYIG